MRKRIGWWQKASRGIALSLGLGASSLLLAQEVSPTKADLQQRIQQLQRAREEVAQSAIEAKVQVDRLREAGRWQRPEEHCLASAPFPMPNPLVGFFGAPPFYVQVLQVARIDDRIFRHYPDSWKGCPYYEITVRVLETWGTYDPEMSNGTVIRLLWSPCRSYNVSPEERALQIWHEGKKYLVLGFRGTALDMPYDEWVYKGTIPFSQYVEKGWLLVGAWPLLVQANKPVSAIERYVAGLYPIFCVTRVPHWVIEEPDPAILDLLNEERVIFQHTRFEERQAWIEQRLQDPNLPLWKKQRTMVYVWNFSDSPELYLRWLEGLEPALRAFGLQLFRYLYREGAPTPREAGEKAQRMSEALGRFLEASHPVEVRREAAWLFAEEFIGWTSSCLRSPESGLGVGWLAGWRERLAALAQAETDEITRLLLESAWKEIRVYEYGLEINALERELRALDRVR